MSAIVAEQIRERNGGLADPNDVIEDRFTLNVDDGRFPIFLRCRVAPASLSIASPTCAHLIHLLPEPWHEPVDQRPDDLAEDQRCHQHPDGVRNAKIAADGRDDIEHLGQRRGCQANEDAHR